jgi:ATP-dependent helicase HepA
MSDSSTKPIKSGEFVSSSANELGVGKFASNLDDATCKVEYFDSPAKTNKETRIVSIETVRRVELPAETRVYWLSPETGDWQTGRIMIDKPVPAEALRQIQGLEEASEYYSVQFPNSIHGWLPPHRLEVRWNQPIGDPTQLLATQTHDSPYWHPGRRALLQSLAFQKQLYAGLTGFSSASIEPFRHQLTIVRQILHDPIPRYILADEVGLGKTIEAGIVIRQHLLDEPNGFVIIAVPTHLIDQWSEELNSKFNLSVDFPEQFVIQSHTSFSAPGGQKHTATMLVVDEAHQVATTAYSANKSEQQIYKSLEILASSTAHVLLLSGTPVLHNEASFLAMLHLLDPSSYDLDDLESFEALVAGRQAVADILRLLDDDSPSLFLSEVLVNLNDLSQNDPSLAALMRRVKSLIDEDESDFKRVGSIRALRSYIQEKYKLYHRLLRTRRSNKVVRSELAKREHELHSYRDPEREVAFDLLEEWRVKASIACLETNKEVGALACFHKLFKASLIHPTTLRLVMNERLQEIQANEQLAYFEDEVALLERAIVLLAKSANSVPADFQETAVIVRDKLDKGMKCIVFVTDKDLAVDLTCYLATQLPDSVELNTGESDLVEHFVTGTAIKVLVCDQASEEGLNLQLSHACIVHFDVPLAVNRIEQRIGRLDRLGIKMPKALSVVLHPTGGYEQKWVKCVTDSIGVFDRSIAGLQHIMDEVGDLVRNRGLHEGAELIDELSSQLCASKGALSLKAEELRTISQEALDSVGEFESVENSYFERIEDYEYEDSASIQDAFEGWTCKNLQCKKIGSNSDSTKVCYSHTEKGHPTLLPKNEFDRVFGQSLDIRSSYHNSESTTQWLSFDRYQSQKQGIPIARVGRHFVDAMEKLVKEDNRGIAFAFWRTKNGYQPADKADIFFQIDFVVSVDLDRAIEHFVSISHFSPAALRRRAEEVFPPLDHTVWLDSDLVPVVDESILEILRRPYSGEPRLGDEFDYGLRAVDRWPIVSAMELTRDWESLCYSVREHSQQVLAKQISLEALCSKAMHLLNDSFDNTEARLNSRIRCADGKSRQVEGDLLKMETRFAEAIASGIEKPIIRLDAIGAVFLSNLNPFVKS